jgi:hypothetical protein
MKKWLTWTVYATPLMTLTTDLGLSVRVSMFEYVRLVTGTSSEVPWNGRGRRLVELTDGCFSEGYSQGLPGLFTPVSLGYPLSVCNKNSTLKERPPDCKCNAHRGGVPFISCEAIDGYLITAQQPV